MRSIVSFGSVNLTTLRSPLINFQLARVDFGVWRCIVSEGASQLTIRQKITELKDAQGKSVFLGEDGMRIVVVLYADLHRYFFVYESLRNAARTCVIPSMVANAVRTTCTQFREQTSPCEDAVLRAWLGLTVSSLSYMDYSFGNVDERPALIARA